jgi:hypothetical protein
MIALQIDIDDERYVVAGVEDWSLLRADVLASRVEQDSTVRDGYIELSAGGLTLPNAEGIRQHFRYTTVPLKIGTRVTISVIEVDTVDPPKKRYRSDKTIQESPFTEEEMREMRYKDYLELKAEFERADG